MTETVQEPIRDLIGRALYEEPPIDGSCTPDWYALSEERRELWRVDADRVVRLLEAAGYVIRAKACPGLNEKSIEEILGDQSQTVTIPTVPGWGG